MPKAKTPKVTIAAPPAKSCAIRARIDPKLKGDAQAILSDLGLTASDAIRMFYKQISLRRGLPFAVEIPNAVTQKAMRDADAGKGTRYASVDEMLKKLEI